MNACNDQHGVPLFRPSKNQKNGNWVRGRWQGRIFSMLLGCCFVIKDINRLISLPCLLGAGFQQGLEGTEGTEKKRQGMDLCRGLPGHHQILVSSVSPSCLK